MKWIEITKKLKDGSATRAFFERITADCERFGAETRVRVQRKPARVWLVRTPAPDEVRCRCREDNTEWATCVPRPQRRCPMCGSRNMAVRAMRRKPSPVPARAAA